VPTEYQPKLLAIIPEPLHVLPDCLEAFQATHGSILPERPAIAKEKKASPGNHAAAGMAEYQMPCPFSNSYRLEEIGKKGEGEAKVAECYALGVIWTEMRSLPITLRPSRRNLILLVAVSISFIWAGWSMRSAHPVLGYVLVSALSLCLIIFVAQMLPNSAHLQLTKERFTIRVLFKESHCRWDECSAFQARHVANGKVLVGWNYVPGYPKAQRRRRLNASLFGAEVMLPDNYGMTPEDLASLMNEVREESLSGKLSPAN
jgi:hypothetical protein